MSQKSRQKQDRRRRRLEKRAAGTARRAARQAEVEAKMVLCPNCDTRYLPGDPDPIHRDGPCDCDAETRARMNALLEARAEEFLAARKLVFDTGIGELITERPDKFEGPSGGLGLIACRSCARLHEESEQNTMFIEGRLIWDGCDRCYETHEKLIRYALDEARARWGWKPVSAVIGGVDPKFVPPPAQAEERGLELKPVPAETKTAAP